MRAYKLLLWKAYFDKGWSLTNYFKYLLAFGGIFQLIDAKQGIIIAVVYVLLCFIVGWIWFNAGLIDTENEVQNVFNPFQREVREALKKRNI